MQKASGIGRLQDASDIDVTLGAGVDGYTLNYDHGTGKFVLVEPVAAGSSALVDCSDVNVTLGAGVDEYALCYDHGTAKFVLRQIAGVYVALVGSGAFQSITNGLYITAPDSLTHLGLSVTQGWDADEYTWQKVFGVYTRTGQEVFVVQGRGKDGAGLCSFNSISTVPEFDSIGLRVFTSISRAQALECRSLIVGANYSVSMSSLSDSTVYGGNNAGDNLFLQSTFNATKGYIILHATGGNCGIGNSAPGTPLDINYPSAITNTVANVLTVRHASSGAPAAGFGVALIFALESTTTENQSAGRVYAVWSEATHATRKAQVVFAAYDTAEREGIRIGANGSAATIGFLGATPSARLAHVADASTTHAITDPADSPVDADALREDLVINVVPSIETQLNNLGTKINSILTTLETFGLHSTS